ncbi:MAG: hypothetical protein ACE5LB_10515, partial [Acidiferrobacterales bacterium]
VGELSGAQCNLDPADYQVYTWADWAAWQPEDGQDCIATSRLRLRVPEVMTLTLSLPLLQLKVL